MSKVVLDDITSGYSVLTKFNSNNQKIEDGFDNTLSRDGTGPNTMSANLDMNSNRVVNLAAPVSSADAVSKAYADSLNIVANTTYTYTGGVERTVTSRLNDSVSVKDFGAVGDGVTNDTTAITNAITALVAAGGGTVWFPKGNYVVSTAIQIPKTNEGTALLLKGAGCGSTRITFSGTGYLFTIGDGNVVLSAFHTVIEDIGMYGANTTPTGAVRLNSAYFWQIKDCIIRDFTNASGVGVLAVAGTPNYHGCITGTQFRNCPIGVSFAGTAGIGANSNFIKQSWFGVHSTTGILLDSVSSNVITQNEFNGSTTTAIQFNNNSDGNKILFNQFDGPTNKVQFITDTSSNTVIFGNTGGGVILGKGTNTFVSDPANNRTYNPAGFVVGNASASSVNINAVPFTVVSPTGLSTDAFTVNNSAGSYLFKVNSAGAGEFLGNLTTHGRSQFKNDVTGNSNVVTVDITGTPAATGLDIKAAASQTADLMRVQNSSSVDLIRVLPSGALVLREQTDPAAPATDYGTLYTRDNGAGKTQLVVRFPTGAIQVIATEP